MKERKTWTESGSYVAGFSRNDSKIPTTDETTPTKFTSESGRANRSPKSFAAFAETKTVIDR